LLPFYVIMIALSPFIMQALRMRFGWLLVLASSVSIFTWGLWHPWALAPAQHLRFPPVLWQAPFVLGMLFGFAWPKYSQWAAKWKILIATATWLLCAALFIMEWGYLWNMQQFSFGTAFVRVPLSTPEGLRYVSLIFAVITTTDLLWGYIGETRFSGFVETLGRRSLPVYVLHLWVVEAAGALAVAWSSIGAWQIILAIASLLVLWAFARVLDVMSQPKKARHVATTPAAIPSIFRPEPIAGAAQ
jgi:hypothetical protein